MSASTYESFSLPVLEAMACGCAVLTTRNKGVLSYAEDGDNCLFIQTRDPCDIARKLLSLQEDTALFTRLCAKGMETAARFSWVCVSEQLIAYYRNLASYRPI
ncbi:D-inositol-3-phosphate glycosyltransferase [bioreactor metagenome]|uniref:D-inositol-3-phosphate glycosyltransferase n=1 Tax=bioreactor metagenome TaxID=1076179 RepID=A0A645I951_9ZZZZ